MLRGRAGPAVLAAGLALALGGCATTDTHLVVVQQSVVGFSASTGTSGTDITLGYDRAFGTSGPLTKSPNPGAPEAMSVISCLDVKSGGVGRLSIDERLATGDAAVAYAQQASKEAGFFKCFADGVQPGAKLSPTSTTTGQ